MLYSDLIELRRNESGTASWCPGTGVSTGARMDAGSFARAQITTSRTTTPTTSRDAIPSTGAGWDRFTQALSVTGNVLVGAVFLGGLYFAPLALERLANFLALL